MRVMTSVFLALGLLVSSGLGQVAYEDFKLVPRYSVEHGQCELRGSYLSELKSRREAGEIIIVISHLGKKEDATFSYRRLHNARTFFTTESLKGGAPLEALVVAEGEVVADKGYLDFFFRGELFLRVYFRENTDLAIDRCGLTEDDEDCLYKIEREFYPCKDQNVNESERRW